MAAIRQSTRAANPPITRNVALQPRSSPMVRPKGRPTIMAMDEPQTTSPKAVLRFPSGASLTAKGVTIDQKTACAQATPRRESISILKPVENPDRMWLPRKSAVSPIISFLFSVFANTSISGSDEMATTQAYTVISMPAFDSEIPKSEAMLESSPMGTNSEVLKMNVASVSTSTGSQAFSPYFLFSGKAFFSAVSICLDKSGRKDIPIFRTWSVFLHL